jgi:hypothetical protein
MAKSIKIQASVPAFTKLPVHIDFGERVVGPFQLSLQSGHDLQVIGIHIADVARRLPIEKPGLALISGLISTFTTKVVLEKGQVIVLTLNNPTKVVIQLNATISGK